MSGRRKRAQLAAGRRQAARQPAVGRSPRPPRVSTAALPGQTRVELDRDAPDRATFSRAGRAVNPTYVRLSRAETDWIGSRIEDQIELSVIEFIEPTD